MLVKDILKERYIGVLPSFLLGARIFSKARAAMVTIAIFIFFPINIALAVVEQQIESIAGGFDLRLLANSFYSDPTLISPEFFDYTIYFLVYGLISSFFLPLGYMAITFATNCVIEEKPFSFADILKALAANAGVFAVATIVISCAEVVLLGAFILPSIYFAVKSYFYTNAIVIDNKGVFSSVKQSFEHTKGRFLSVFFMIAIFFAIRFLILNLAVDLAYLFISENTAYVARVLILGVAQTLAAYLCAPLYSGASVWYVNIGLTKDKQAA